MALPKNLAVIKQALLETFVYTPPLSAYKAARVLLFANLGYALGASPAINWGTLSAVLRGIRRVTPLGRILIVDKICPPSAAASIFARSGIQAALDAEMRIAPLDDLVMTAYPNPAPTQPDRITLRAPAYLSEFDSVIVVTTDSAIGYLRHLIPCQDTLSQETEATQHHDAFFTFGKFIHSAVVEHASHPQQIKVTWGEDLLALEQMLFSTNMPLYLQKLSKTQD